MFEIENILLQPNNFKKSNLMKKLILLFSVVLMTLGVSAQNFYFGGAFSAKSTWLLNKAVFDRGASQDIGASFGTDFGIIAGMQFDESTGLELNFLFNSFSQNYVGQMDISNEEYTSKSIYKSVDIPILFKTGEGAYFEVGPVLSFVNKASFQFDWSNALYGDTAAYDNKESYNNFVFGAMMGFGGNIDVSDNLKITLGLRFYYGITDLGGVNAFGWNKAETTRQDEIYQLFKPTEDNHYGHKDFKTNPLSGALKIGLIYIVE